MAFGFRSSAIVGCAALVTVIGSQGCGTAKGALMLSITTDMKAPKDVNAVSITISRDGAVRFNAVGRITPEGDVLLPATLAIAEGDDAGGVIRIRVMAFQERRARVLRDVRTSIPSGGRVALLRLPLNFVNDGSVKGELPASALPPKASATTPAERGVADPFVFLPECPNPEDTFIDGECKAPDVDPASLPDFAPEEVFGAGEGACFDVKKCFAGATPVAGFDPTTCTVNVGERDLAKLNLAIVTPDTGECTAPGTCFIPLDKSDLGWREVSPNVIQVSPGICRRVRERIGQSRLFASVQSADCTAKTESRPICTDKAAPATSGCARDAEINCGETPNCPFSFAAEKDYCVKVTTEECELTRRAPGTVPFTVECAERRATETCPESLGQNGLPGKSACFLVGTLPDGSPCKYTSQCKSANCASNASTPGCGVCKPRLPLGSDCESTGSSCDFDLVCNHLRPPAHCEKPTKIGQPCTSQDICEGGSSCVGGACVANLAEGAPCGTPADRFRCAPLLECLPRNSPDARCSRIKTSAGLGEPCGRSTTAVIECKLDLICSGDTGGTCQPRPAIGEKCFQGACAQLAECGPDGTCRAIDPLACNRSD